MTDKTKAELIDDVLHRGVDAVYPSEAALVKLLSRKPITLYLGVDPSAPDLHIGNAVPLQKLRQFQQLGHKVILLIGDFTGQTGDPTDKQAVRKPLTKQEVLANAKHYQKQASTILDFKGKNPAVIRYNSEWLGKLSFDEVADLAGHFTVQQMLERDMFENRIKEGKPVSLREFLYPLMQGYDSVAMEVDLEVGATDQTFNMLAGRKLVKEYLGKEKFVLALKLLADANGVKIGKSEGNAINISGKPEDLFGQVMSLPDEVIVQAMETVTSVPMAEVRELAKLVKKNPRDAKMALASAVVTEFQGEKAALKGRTYFVNVFQQGGTPDDVPVWRTDDTELKLWELLKKSGLAPSSSEARRLISQGAVRVNEIVYDDPDHPVNLTTEPIIQVGKKKFLRVAR